MELDYWISHTPPGKWLLNYVQVCRILDNITIIHGLCIFHSGGNGEKPDWRNIYPRGGAAYLKVSKPSVYRLAAANNSNQGKLVVSAYGY